MLPLIPQELFLTYIVENLISLKMSGGVNEAAAVDGIFASLACTDLGFLTVFLQ